MGMGFRGGHQRGGGYGMRSFAAAAVPTPEQADVTRKPQTQNLESALADIQKRLSDLEAGK
jgi:hypothetical protein